MLDGLTGSPSNEVQLYNGEDMLGGDLLLFLDNAQHTDEEVLSPSKLSPSEDSNSRGTGGQKQMCHAI
jgi:hypothetical protein